LLPAEPGFGAARAADPRVGLEDGRVEYARLVDRDGQLVGRRLSVPAVMRLPDEERKPRLADDERRRLEQSVRVREDSVGIEAVVDRLRHRKRRGGALVRSAREADVAPARTRRARDRPARERDGWAGAAR